MLQSLGTCGPLIHPSKAAILNLGEKHSSTWPSSLHPFVLTCTCGGIHPGQVVPLSPRENHGDVSWEVSTQRSPVPASLHLLALQLKPSMLGLRAPEHLLFANPLF